MEFETGNPDPNRVKEVVVKGYARIKKPTDSVSFAKATYYVNGKQMSATEFQKAVKVEDIKNINVEKSPTKVMGIHIVTKEKP
jgi:hypothetical protein